MEDEDAKIITLVSINICPEPCSCWMRSKQKLVNDFPTGRADSPGHELLNLSQISARFWEAECRFCWFFAMATSKIAFYTMLSLCRNMFPDDEKCSIVVLKSSQTSEMLGESFCVRLVTLSSWQRCFQSLSMDFTSLEDGNVFLNVSSSSSSVSTVPRVWRKRGSILNTEDHLLYFARAWERSVCFRRMQLWTDILTHSWYIVPCR